MNDILDFFEIDAIRVNSTAIDLSNAKLNPDYYSSNQIFINNLNTNPLHEFCYDIFMGPIFKRDTVTDKKYGIGFLASNEIILYEPEINYITTEQAKKLNLIINDNMILVTGYGTIGSVRIVDKIIKGYAIADNVTRIIPKMKKGFIACFLSSEFGQNLLNDYSSGSSVKFIQAPQIAQIPIPILPEEIISITNDMYLDGVKCREDAHLKLTEARQLVLEYNYLPPLDEVQPENLDPEKETELQLVSTEEFTADYRLDAHFYNPMAELVVRNIRENTGRTKYLFEISDCSYRGGRAPRNYVKKEHGVPFLSGKNIIQIKPDLKYISQTETKNLEDLIIERNWILITRSGTLGRTVFIWNNYEKFAASEHLIRIIPYLYEIDEAYLYAFLSSDYGYHQLVRYKHGAVIDEITEDQISQLIIPIPDPKQQKEIGDLVRQAYDLRAEAIRLENEAQEILTQALTGK